MSLTLIEKKEREKERKKERKKEGVHSKPGYIAITPLIYNLVSIIVYIGTRDIFSIKYQN